MAKTILIAAGGTGGHLFPAEALAHELGPRGYDIHLATDHRATNYGGAFPAVAVHIVASATFGDRSPLGLARSGARLLKGQIQSFGLVARLKPAAAIGFGGYPTLPPLLAAAIAGRPTLVHEANAVMGRANRFLAPRVTCVATSFSETGLIGDAAGKAVTTGNPVRPRVIAAVRPYDPPVAGGRLRLMVFGGSQGARVFADLMPPALERLDADLRSRLDLVQQVRAEDLDRVGSVYARLGLRHDISPFFTDLPERMAAQHLIVCRSGASSVAELTVIGRPSILVPLPHALDNDQKTNAIGLEKAGGAIMAEQAGLTPDRLAELITGLAADPARLVSMAAAAKAEGRPDAVVRLADLVEHIAGGGKPTEFKRF